MSQPAFHRKSIILGLGVVALFLNAMACQAEDRSNVPQYDAIQNFDGLRQQSLPKGSFEGWCGLENRYFMKASEVDPRPQLYEGTIKLTTFPEPVQCGNDGRKVISIRRPKGETGLQVSELEIGSRAIRKLATYESSLKDPVKVKFSPDLTSVATNGPLTLSGDGGRLNVIQLVTPKGSYIRVMGWSEDSKMLFTVTASNQVETEGIEVFDTKNRKIGAGNVPSGYGLERAVFTNDKQNLLLLLTLLDDPFGEGFIFQCNIQTWQCRSILDRVVDLSVGGRGLLATVRALGKATVNDGDGGTPPSQYLAEIRNQNGILVRQIFSSADRSQVGVKVSPSGTKAVLVWNKTRPSKCQELLLKVGGQCGTGTIVDLPEMAR